MYNKTTAQETIRDTWVADSGAFVCATSVGGPDILLFCRVQITVVDVYGQRHVLRALTGHTLVDVLTEHQELLGSEGTVCLLCQCSWTPEQCPLPRR